MKQIREMQQIARAEDIEFSKLEASTKEVIRNMFVFTADEIGVSRFEKILKINKKPEWDLQTRKLNIAIRLKAKKISISEIKRLLLEYGEDVSIMQDNERMEMRIWINSTSETKLKMLYGIIDDSMPLNIFCLISATEKMQSNIYKTVINRITPRIIMKDKGLPV